MLPLLVFFSSAHAEPSQEPTEESQDETTESTSNDSEEKSETSEEKSLDSEDVSNQDTQKQVPQDSTDMGLIQKATPNPESKTETPIPEESPTEEQSKPAAPTEAIDSTPSIDLQSAKELDNLTRKQLLWLRPLPERFEQNPYLHVDFTSYCLEWGEFQLGLNTLKAGVLPRTQLGTSIPMWALGLQNVDAKINLFRYGAFDLALDANWLSLPTADFRMSFLGSGLSTSIRVMEPWTIHLGSQYMSFGAQGLPDLDSINPFILQMSGVDADGYRDELAADNVGFDIQTSLVTLKFATDIRFNRRDSLILQAQGIIWHRIDSSSNLNESQQVPKFLNADEIFALQSEGFSDISKSYVVSLAHQWSWNHSYLRLGFGWSSMNEYAFAPAVIQSIDYAWRFGGKSKNREGRIRKGWNENRKENDQK